MRDSLTTTQLASGRLLLVTLTLTVLFAGCGDEIAPHSFFIEFVVNYGNGHVDLWAKTPVAPSHMGKIDVETGTGVVLAAADRDPDCDSEAPQDRLWWIDAEVREDFDTTGSRRVLWGQNYTSLACPAWYIMTVEADGRTTLVKSDLPPGSRE
jgi:hypothetical protein